MSTETRRFGGRFRRTRTPKEAEQVMTLTAHLKELRNRLLVSVGAIMVGSIIGLVYYDPILDLLTQPYLDAAEKLDLDEILALPGITAPFTFNLMIALVVGVIVASPIWLFQIWRFITPGLHTQERRWALVFSVTAGPLFIIGASIAYYVMPVGIEVMLSFTPEGVTNFNDLGEYLQFILRLLLVFGVAFELPVFLVLLNFAGIVTGERLGRWRRGAVFGIFVFSAVATPTGDPVTMLLLAVPMWLLFEVAVVVCKIHDKRRGGEPDYDEWGDDEQSPLYPTDTS
jgi:sec-independent protein translocase protein TatC